MGAYIVKSSDLTAVADAIRTKGGTSAALTFPSGFVTAVENIPSGGGNTDYAICCNYSLYTSNYRSVTTDGSYGPTVTTRETRAAAGDYVYIARNSSMSARVENVDTGDTVTAYYFDEYNLNLSKGGTPPPDPGANIITVWRFVMPSADVLIIQ